MPAKIDPVPSLHAPLDLTIHPSPPPVTPPSQDRIHYERGLITLKFTVNPQKPHDMAAITTFLPTMENVVVNYPSKPPLGLGHQPAGKRIQGILKNKRRQTEYKPTQILIDIIQKSAITSNQPISWPLTWNVEGEKPPLISYLHVQKRGNSYELQFEINLTQIIQNGTRTTYEHPAESSPRVQAFKIALGRAAVPLLSVLAAKNQEPQNGGDRFTSQASPVQELNKITKPVADFIQNLAQESPAVPSSDIRLVILRAYLDPQSPMPIHSVISHRTSEIPLAKAPDEQGPRREMYVEGLARRATKDNGISDVLCNKSKSTQGKSLTAILNYLTFKRLPDYLAIHEMAERAKLRPQDIHALIIDHVFPQLRDRIRELGMADFSFYIDPRSEQSWVKKMIEQPIQVGTRLWLARKKLGFTIDQMANHCRVSIRLYGFLEKNDVFGMIDSEEIRRLAQGTGIDLAVLTNALRETFPDRVKAYPVSKPISPLVPIAPPPQKTRSQPATKAEQINHLFFEATGLPAQITEPVVKNIDRMPQVRVSDRHLAAATLLLPLDEACKMWIRGLPELGKLFPTLLDSKPHLTVPSQTRLTDLWQISIPAKILEALIERKLANYAMLPLLGISRSSNLDPYISWDYGLENADRLAFAATNLGLDPRMAYLSRYPWILLALPLVDDHGNPIPTFFHEEPSSLTNARKRFAGVLAQVVKNLSDGRDVIRNALIREGLMDDDKLTTPKLIKLEKHLDRLGLKPTTKMHILPSSRSFVLTDAELVEVATRLPSIDKKRLLEGYRKGELALFLGQTTKGAVDWSIPPDLDFENEQAQLLAHLDELYKSRQLLDPLAEWSLTSYQELKRKITSRFGISAPEIYKIAKIFEGQRTRRAIYLALKYKFLKIFFDVPTNNEPSQTGFGSTGTTFVPSTGFAASPGLSGKLPFRLESSVTHGGAGTSEASAIHSIKVYLTKEPQGAPDGNTAQPAEDDPFVAEETNALANPTFSNAASLFLESPLGPFASVALPPILSMVTR